ncbi:MAG: Holliday junction branch migration protein RuvA [Gammaproteobacteria bacterium]
MIGHVRGRLVQKQPPLLIVDVGGVGYEIESPMTTIYKLPEIGEEIHLYTHLVVREDAHLLFGFATPEERRLFRTLIRVNGVGARMALTILSGIEADEFAQCIQEGDAARLVRLPGIGRKTAERLIVEMRDRLADWETGAGAQAAAGEGGDAAAEAVSALVALGYKPQEASRYVHAVAAEGMAPEAIIREALRALVHQP